MGCQKRYFLIFLFFDFDDFLIVFAKNLMKRTPAFLIDIRCSYKLLLTHKDLRSKIFDREARTLEILLKLCTETRFHCLFSLNKKVIAMCYLMIHIKCVAAICFSENWSSLKCLFEITGRQTWCFIFLGFFLLVVFTAFLPKTS